LLSGLVSVTLCLWLRWPLCRLQGCRIGPPCTREYEAATVAIGPRALGKFREQVFFQKLKPEVRLAPCEKREEPGNGGDLVAFLPLEHVLDHLPLHVRDTLACKILSNSF